MSAEAWQAAAVWFSVLANLAISLVWLFLASRLLSWVLYERNGLERNPSQTLKFALRRIVCKHQRGYARVRNSYGLNYTACAYCGANMDYGRRQEDRV